RHAATQAALATLQERGHLIIEPAEGDVACGENGQGKLASNASIVREVLDFARFTEVLAGKRVLITGGPTREPIDGVRFLSNRSSGKMAAALAQAAIWMGADTTVVSGPVDLNYPLRAKVVRVETAQQMLDACLDSVENADLVIGCAAVADYRVKTVTPGKIRRSEGALELKLIPNPDIIAQLAARCPGRVVGFAAEPTDDPTIAMEKLKRKGLYAIAANDVSRTDIGFGSNYNEISLIYADGRFAQSGRQTKLSCAQWLLTELA
ncbi:MAG TPA: bifunctional phosphopantothenoylcysteine decarboxylase/phosphopantothenate--cysteine ligase CoaBC, partial [Fimbriimonadaceae bacterium]|nr:bifunctional phosphopantothenoylcysteine decarboxylase/phosphopantothenate--cysteine ligase CoaBC [Fimbriimonadaceae bacterium]